MALQGTLDTFELPDVLRLLASTRKSGRLHLRGDRGDGDVWLTDGRVVGMSTVAGDELSEGLFELLRAREGCFDFEPGDTPVHAAPPVDVEPLLASVEGQLAEWREIEAVVPSLAAWVALSSELPRPSVTIDADTWRLVATIGSGLTVGDLGDALGLAEVPVCRLVKELVGLGIGTVGDAPPHAGSTAERSTPEPVAYDPAPVVAPVEDIAAYEPVAYEPAPFEPAPETPAPLFAAVDEPVVHPATHFDLALERVEDPDEADEVARQLAMLSPRAAQAIAAAAASDSEEERQAALAAVDDADEPVNRGLLLKFLSSVK